MHLLGASAIEAGLIGGAVGLVGAAVTSAFRWYYRSGQDQKWVMPANTDRWVMAFVVVFFAVLIGVGYLVIKKNS